MSSSQSKFAMKMPIYCLHLNWVLKFMQIFLVPPIIHISFNSNSMFLHWCLSAFSQGLLMINEISVYLILVTIILWIKTLKFSLHKNLLANYPIILNSDWYDVYWHVFFVCSHTSSSILFKPTHYLLHLRWIWWVWLHTNTVYWFGKTNVKMYYNISPDNI